MYWSSPLDNSHAQGVNPITNAEYFEVLREVWEEYDIPDELVYGADETGIQTGIGITEHVIGPAGSKIQHQQRNGNRENITILPTICADGTSVPPTVIYKGEAFQTKWLQENPLDARYGPTKFNMRKTKLTSSRMSYQKKGYTDGEISVAWLEDWDKLTKMKANKHYRLLIVDGHSSHYTMSFLEYARNNKIIVVCYPSHSTHVYQGLDVVIFSALKWAWSDERDRFERSGPVVSKTNFLAVYARAHVRAFTQANILAAFTKTGIVPFNPGVVTEAMMAPSLETSTSSLLPLPVASPVQELVDLISQHQACKRKREDDNDLPRTPSALRIPDAPYTPVRRAVNALASTSASFVVSQSAFKSTSCLPTIQTMTISPNIPRDEALLAEEPSTEREKLLMAALQESHRTNECQKAAMMTMQAETLLQCVYVQGVRGQLQGQEEKKAKAAQTGRLNLKDGKAKVLTQNDIFEGIKAAHEARDAAKEALSKRKDAKERYTEAMTMWKVREMDRKERNDRVKGIWKQDVKRWEAERDSAKYDRRKPRWKKPKMPPVEKGSPKPKVSNFVDESKEEGNMDEDENKDGEISDGTRSDS